MIERNELILLQAEAAARLQAERDAEADRIADEIIDEILAEEPGGDLRRARQAEAYERELMAAAARIKKWQTVETDSLPAIRRALAEKQFAAPVALALAYQLGLEFGRGLTRRLPAHGGDPS
jgi:hypothetical protein